MESLRPFILGRPFGIACLATLIVFLRHGVLQEPGTGSLIRRTAWPPALAVTFTSQTQAITESKDSLFAMACWLC
jgi:hypothetical protein